MGKRGEALMHNSSSLFNIFRLRYVFVLILIVSGCAVNSQDIKGINIISIQEEKELGLNFSKEVEKQYKVYENAAVSSYINSMGNRLVNASRDVKFDYTFKVVKDETLNAFAIPGGHVYVHTGLIKAAKNENELAGVIAHEINHVVARHGTRQMTQQYGYGLLLQVVIGNNPGMLSQLAANLFGKAGSMSYSRSMETQADILAVETMNKAGYDPEGLVTFFSTLEGKTKTSPDMISKYFSSHPQTDDRIQRVKNEITKQGRGVTALQSDLQTFKRIKGLVN